MKKDICISLDMIMTGAVIKKKISKSGLSVREIQERMQLACPQPVYRWMKGRAMPSLDNLYTLSGILGVQMEDLLLPRHSRMWLLHFGINDSRVMRMKPYRKVAGKKDGTMHEVIITANAREAAFLDKRRIPYIVLLNEENRGESFPCGAYCVERLGDIDGRYIERVYRRFAGLPWDIAETERLKIREITEEDVARLYELYRGEGVVRYMDALFPDPEQEIEYTKNYIKNIYGFYGYGMWILEEKASGKVIGRAGLEYREGFDGLELGFMLGADYQHKGYAYEACKAVISYGINELGQTQYCSFVDKDNAPSVRLCGRLGFVPEKTVRLDGINFNGMMETKEYVQYVYSAG